MSIEKQITTLVTDKTLYGLWPKISAVINEETEYNVRDSAAKHIIGNIRGTVNVVSFAVRNKAQARRGIIL